MNRDDAVTAVAEALAALPVAGFAYGVPVGPSPQRQADAAVAAMEPYIAARIAAEAEALRREVEQLRARAAHVGCNDALSRSRDFTRRAEADLAEARAALALALAEHEPEDVPDSEHYYCRPADCDRAGEGVLVARCKTCETVHPCATRRAITGEA